MLQTCLLFFRFQTAGAPSFRQGLSSLKYPLCLMFIGHVFHVSNPFPGIIWNDQLSRLVNFYSSVTSSLVLNFCIPSAEDQDFGCTRRWWGSAAPSVLSSAEWRGTAVFLEVGVEVSAREKIVKSLGHGMLDAGCPPEVLNTKNRWMMRHPLSSNDIKCSSDLACCLMFFEHPLEVVVGGSWPFWWTRSCTSCITKPVTREKTSQHSARYHS